MKKIFTKKAFTLIEIMLVIVIMIILLTISYAPYNYYQNKTKVKLATKEVAQGLYEARNMAVSGIQERNGEDTKSRYVGVLLSKKDTENSFIRYYYIDSESIKKMDDGTVNVDTSKININNEIKKKDIEKGTLISNFPGISSDEIFLIYSIEGEIFLFEKSGSNFTKLTSDKLKLEISFQKSNSNLLKKEIIYYLKTNIVDYEKN